MSRGKTASVRRLFIASISVAALSIMACFSDDAVPTATPTPALTSGSDIFVAVTQTQATQKEEPTQVPIETPAATSTTQPTANVYEYNSDNAMFRIFAGFDLTTGYQPSNNRVLAALEDVLENEDRSLVPVIVESMRYAFSNDVIRAMGDTLRSLTGQNFEDLDWRSWAEWLGNNRDQYPPPDDYFEWKINYLRQIDPRFSLFLTPAQKGRTDIDLTELEWGGVRPDGIPDLKYPGHIAAAEAEYIEDDERVVGLSINGEHRAYPLRIVNAHELVNDVLGGEQLALTW